MSYNLDRRVERTQMKQMMKEFRKEASLSNKQLYAILVAATKQPLKGLRDRFEKMLGLAAGKYKLPQELDTSSFNNVEESAIGS